MVTVIARLLLGSYTEAGWTRSTIATTRAAPTIDRGLPRIDLPRQSVSMSDYCRNRVPGGTYFFTVNLRTRRSDLLVAQIVRLREAVRAGSREKPFHVDAWVVLPDHLHCLWTLPPGDADFPRRWQTIKTLFSKSLDVIEPRSANRLRRGERGIWQRRYWEHTIRDERDYAAHMDYIHFNPVKHGLVREVGLWPYSTFHRSVALGLYPASWAGGFAEPEETGERR